MRPEEIEIGAYYVHVDDPVDQVRVIEVTPNDTATLASVKTEPRWGGGLRSFEASSFARAFRPL